MCYAHMQGVPLWVLPTCEACNAHMQGVLLCGISTCKECSCVLHPRARRALVCYAHVNPHVTPLYLPL